jgi:hypothetical protein
MLYGILDQHPSIHMAKPVRPEPKYFLHHAGPYVDYKDKLFHPPMDVIWLGEKSTSYYETPYVAERIKNLMPDARIVFIMRNPVDRALSNYWFSKENGFETRTLEEVFLQPTNPVINAQKGVSVNPFDYLGRGSYSKYIKPYLDLFGPEQFLPLIFEEVVSDVKLLKVWDFLDIEPIEFVRQNEFKNGSQPLSMNEEVRLKLADHFAPLNQELSQTLHLDLSIWNS